MIFITIAPAGVTVTGHADKTKADHALVCCAVSTVVQGFVLSFNALSDKPLSYKITDGDAIIDWGNAPDEAGFTLIEAFCMILTKLASDNPGHIVISD